MAHPSLLVFGPQSAISLSRETLAEVRTVLLHDTRLSVLVRAIRDLPEIWNLLVSSDSDLNRIPGLDSIHKLSRWIDKGELTWSPENLLNILFTPLTVIIQLVQYFQYLGKGKTQRNHSSILASTSEGGVQGFCTGFLTASVVACSKNETELSDLGAVAIRLAVCIGAYVDLDGSISKPLHETTCLAVRWKTDVGSKDKALNTLKDYPDAYISVITDSTSVTITASRETSLILEQALTSQGLAVKPVGLQGRFHSRYLQPALEKLIKLSRNNSYLQLPTADQLLVPLRSNTNAQLITEGALEEIALKSLLVELANWHLTISGAVDDLVKAECPLALVFGLANIIPRSTIRESNLKVIRLNDSLGAVEFNTDTSPTTPGEEAPILEETTEDYQYPPHSIAVVGMSCKFPGADSLEEFWEVIRSGASQCQPVPPEKFSTTKLRRTPETEQFFGNFVNDVDAFDHRFFKKSSREAASMDPQQRLLLQVAYQAMESAGYFGEFGNAPQDIGCYIGVCATDYNDNVASHPPTAFSSLGTLRAFLSGKISHYFGWTGPSVTYDTACSSSAVAIDAACKAIAIGDCSRAIAGGVNLFTNPNFYQNLQAGTFLSPTGPTKAFDAKADGYCRGEGVGLVVLKKLSAAIAEGDNILAVITGSSVNQNKNETYITVPHGPSQVDLYQKVVRLSHIDPMKVSFVEAHGTGTPVGDPIECASIRQVFGGAQRKDMLYLGSVKGNIGHTEGASGVAALIKAVLMIQKGIIPTQANFSTLNPNIPALDIDRITVPTSTQPWEQQFRAICINNYGAAGSNAAILVCQSPLSAKNSELKSPSRVASKLPIFISASSPTSLTAYCDRLQKYVANNSLMKSGKTLLADLAFNLANKQSRTLQYAITSTVSSVSELKDFISTGISSKNQAHLQIPSQTLPVVLAFGGQVGTTVGLPLEVFNSSARLRAHLDYCDKILRNSGLHGIYPEIFQTEAIDDVVILHSALFSMQYACTKAWIDSGLRVDAIVGHSFGQLTALCVSGSISIENGLKLVAGRASLMRKYWGPEHGAMISLETDLDTVLQIIESLGDSTVEIACYNGPTSYVLVGSIEAIGELETKLATTSSLACVKSKKLNVTYGFHSQFTEPILNGLESLAETINFQEPIIPLETCSDIGSWRIASPKLIAQHTRTPVYFGQAVDRIIARLGPCTWLEAGAGSPITNMVRRALGSSANSHNLQALQFPASDPVGYLAQTTVALWKLGYKVHFWPFHHSQTNEYSCMNLPPYQFEKTRHWLPWVDYAEARVEILPAPTSATIPKAPVLLELVTLMERTATFVIDPNSEEWSLFVGGHAVLANPLCPAPLYAELVIRAGNMANSKNSAGSSIHVPCLEDMEIKAPLGLDLGKDINLLLKKLDGTSHSWAYSIISRPQGESSADSIEHATGRLTLLKPSDPNLSAAFSRFERLTRFNYYESLINDPVAESMKGALVYKVFAKVVQYADYYKGVRSVSAKDKEVVGTVKLPHHGHRIMEDTSCNPLAIDNFVQVAGLHVNSLSECGDDEVFICTKIDSVQLGPEFATSDPNQTTWMVYSNYTSLNEKEVNNDIFVFDTATKKLVMVIFGAHFTKVLIRSLARVLSRANPPLSGIELNKPETKSRESLTVTQLLPTAQSTISLAETAAEESGPDLESALYELLCKVADAEMGTFTSETTLEELGIDSLMAMEVLGEIRQAFDVDIPPTEFQDLQDIRSLCDFLTPRVKGFKPPSVSAVPSLISSGQSSSAVSTPASVFEEPLSHDNLVQSLAKMIAEHLETSEKMSNETCLADEGLDSLLSIELVNDIEKQFGAKVELTPTTTFGDIASLVLESKPDITLSNDQPSYTTPKITATKPAVPSVAISSVVNSQHVSANMVGAQQAFENIKADYDLYAKESGFAHFWSTTYLAQADLVVAYTLEAFESLGCSLESLAPQQPLHSFQYLQKHKLEVMQLHQILVDASLIEAKNGGFVRTHKPLPTIPSLTLYEQILKDFPQHASEHRLLHVTGSRLADCLTGTADPLILLFRSAENRTLLEDVYTNGPMYSAVTKQLESFFMKAFSVHTSNKPFHILELGGGTGGTTKAIVELLLRFEIPVTYTFTDLAPSLVAAAKKKFAGVKFMQFQVLDIEKTPPEKLHGYFHAILSTNCIHATTDLVNSTTNIRKMLRPDGFLSLVEFTKNMFWFDLVFGLLDGWWLYKDGRKHVLADEYFWERSMKAAGFKYVSWSGGETAESNTLRIITGFLAERDSSLPKSKIRRIETETVVFKQTGHNLLYADIYYPSQNITSEKRPIALMVHGGGFTMLSRSDINPKHIQYLLDAGFLPVSVDYRLCPEVNILDGPMADVCSALHWTRTELPSIRRLRYPTLEIVGSKVVVVGWSTGGHLAMTLAWTAPAHGLEPPNAILAFYCPTDFEDACWTRPNFPSGTAAAAAAETYDLLEGVYDAPITSYNPPTNQHPVGGWLSLADPRSRIVLDMNWKAHFLPIVLNGLPSKRRSESNTLSFDMPARERIVEISPYAQIQKGKYKTPTFLVHGTVDDLIPWEQSERLCKELAKNNVVSEFGVVEGARHLFDLAGENVGSEVVKRGIEFLVRSVNS